MDDEREWVECDACREMKPEAGGETITVFIHRVEGQPVGRDQEWICKDCVEAAEYNQWP